MFRLYQLIVSKENTFKCQFLQLNDSSLIISILRSYMLGKGSLENLLIYYPTMETGEGRSKKLEYQNRHNVMYMEAMESKEKANAVR